MDIYITSYGIVSAIGASAETNLRSLREQRSGIRPIQVLETRHDGWVAGEVLLTDDELVQRTGASPAMTRTALLGTMAVQETLERAGISRNETARIGFISATTVGGMTITENHYERFLAGEKTVPFVDTNDNGASTEQMADHFGFRGYVTTINTACSSSANAIALGARLIRSGRLNQVIVGGKDAFCRFSLNGFNSAMLVDPTPCKPFDSERRGINIGEGAAYLLLESAESVRRSGRKPIARLRGWGSTNDAYHQTATSPDGRGLQLALTQALTMAGLSPSAIQYVNAHGTATPNNDLTEGMALKDVFGPEVCFSSTKGSTGHTLAAAGALEAVFALMSLEHQFTPVNLGFTQTITEHGLKPVTTITRREPIRHTVSTSIGAGGSCNALIFSR